MYRCHCHFIAGGRLDLVYMPPAASTRPMALTTTVILSATGWNEDDPSDLPMSYSFSYSEVQIGAGAAGTSDFTSAATSATNSAGGACPGGVECSEERSMTGTAAVSNAAAGWVENQRAVLRAARRRAPQAADSSRIDKMVRRTRTRTIYM